MSHAVGVGSIVLLASFFMDMNIKLQPWITPNFVIGVMPARPRQEGFNPDAAPKWALKEVEAETLAKMCDEFRADIFRKAGKPDPANTKTTDAEATP